jgi:hypothetical protein
MQIIVFGAAETVMSAGRGRCLAAMLAVAMPHNGHVV